jgi:hypothetical protein
MSPPGNARPGGDIRFLLVASAGGVQPGSEGASCSIAASFSADSGV